MTAAPGNSNVTPEEEETADENDAALPNSAQEENSVSIGDGCGEDETSVAATRRKDCLNAASNSSTPPCA